MKEPTKKGCYDCAMVRINGLLCHEHGCPQHYKETHYCAPQYEADGCENCGQSYEDHRSDRSC